MMRNVRKAAFVALTLCVWLLPTLAYAQPVARRYDGYQVVRVKIDNESERKTLRALDAASRDFQIWSDRLGPGIIDVRVSPKQKRVLDASGLRYVVEIEDLQRRLDEMFKGAGEPEFFDSYRTYLEHVTFLNDLAEAYPDLAETFSVGTSVLGRPMWTIRITGPGEDKPGVMYHGAQHGNEVMGACVVAYMAEYLLTRYDSDPEVRTLVDNVEWHLLTIMNPDGYEVNDRHNASDVDLNRNWGGPGAGNEPFSQPETAAMRDFFLSHPNVHAHLDFHTHGRMILWPWGYTDELCEDNLTFEYLGDEMAELIFQLRGSDYDQRGPIYTTIYPVIGGSVDYSYGELRLWAIAFELGFSHSMPSSEIMPTCEEIAPTMLFLSKWVSDCNDNGILDSEDIAGGLSTDCNDNATPDECETINDFDGDGLLNPCDPDIDDDGVLNGRDECDFTPLGSPVDEDGRPISDSSGDCDVSLIDYRRFISCIAYSGPGTTSPSPYCISLYDYDGDQDIDLADFSGVARAFTGGP